MHIWLVIYAGMAITDTIGPLPYTLSGCQEVAAAQMSAKEKFLERGKSPTGANLTDREKEHLKIVSFKCVSSDTDPKGRR